MRRRSAAALGVLIGGGWTLATFGAGVSRAVGVGVLTGAAIMGAFVRHDHEELRATVREVIPEVQDTLGKLRGNTSHLHDLAHTTVEVAHDALMELAHHDAERARELTQRMTDAAAVYTEHREP